MKIPNYEIEDEAIRKALFYESIKRIVFENFNYCNRACSFCINSLIDRRSDIKTFDETLFQNLIKELSNANYRNTIAIGRYSEPLSMRLTIDRLKTLREQLPFAHLLINTNGDYLNVDLINELNNAGLDELKIMVYLPHNVAFNISNAMEFCTGKLKLMGFDVFSNSVKIDSLVYFKVFREGEMRVSLRCEDYSDPERGCDRGGSLMQLSSSKRTTSCISPYYEINIDYNGSVLPCCNMTSDYEPHVDYILGNIAHNTLFDIYFNERATWFRSTLGSPERLQSPCQNCSYNYPKNLT
jgi:radical SAM protein with 4Fe4S-binding SPASM domain